MDKIFVYEQNSKVPNGQVSLFENTSVITPVVKNKHPIKSLVQLGVTVLLSNLSLEYMSGDELLDYVKNSFNVTLMVVKSTITNEFNEELGCTTQNTTAHPNANPFGHIKKTNSLIFKKQRSNAA